MEKTTHSIGVGASEAKVACAQALSHPRRPGVAAALSMAILLGACQVPRTYYDEAGRPHTRMEHDALQTVGAILLVGLVVAAVAANNDGEQDEGR